MVRIQRNWNYYALLLEYKIVQLLWKAIWWFINKLNINYYMTQNCPLLGIYPKEWKAETQMDIFIPVSIAALLIAVKS